MKEALPTLPEITVRVFVSSTWADLQPERKQIEEALQRIRETKFVGMEYFGSRDEAVRQTSLDEVDKSDVYVGILGGRYGSGITEAEFQRAKARGLPCFVYFKEEATISPESRENDPDLITRLEIFRAVARQGTVISFTSPQDLAAKVTADMHRWLFDSYLPPLLEKILADAYPFDKALSLLSSIKDTTLIKKDLLARLLAAGAGFVLGKTLSELNQFRSSDVVDSANRTLSLDNPPWDSSGSLEARSTRKIIVTEISFQKEIIGKLTERSQVQKDNITNNYYYFDAYLFNGVAGKSYAIDCRSSEFDAAVLLHSVSATNTLTFIAADDQSGGYGDGQRVGNDALLFVVAPATGRFAIFATSADVDPQGKGSYTLKVIPDAVKPIRRGETVKASISTNSIKTSAGTYLDAYGFYGKSGELIWITMHSNEFNPFLILQTNAGDPPIASAGESRAQSIRMNVILPSTGIYILLATPYETNKTGKYTLSFEK